MELDNIEKLLEKYFEATTTVAEESKLRDLFFPGGCCPTSRAIQTHVSLLFQGQRRTVYQAGSTKT